MECYYIMFNNYCDISVSIFNNLVGFVNGFKNIFGRKMGGWILVKIVSEDIK